MSISANVIANYGEIITIGGTAAKGFISAVNASDGDKFAMPLPAGVNNSERYRLITSALSPEVSMSVTCGGREYVILRVEPVHIFGTFSHNECIMRLKGGAGDV